MFLYLHQKRPVQHEVLSFCLSGLVVLAGLFLFYIPLNPSSAVLELGLHYVKLYQITRRGAEKTGAIRFSKMTDADNFAMAGIETRLNAI